MVAFRIKAQRSPAAKIRAKWINVPAVNMTPWHAVAKQAMELTE